MKLFVLCEKSAVPGFDSEFGLSYLIVSNHKSILFDTGHSDVFIRNAERMNLDLDRIPTVVLSHGHWDHGNGLKHLFNKQLICHPQVFTQRFRRGEGSYVGLDSSYQDLAQKFSLIQTKTPYFLTPEIVFLGEIPRSNSFEAPPDAFVDQYGSNDDILDDSALVIIKPDGLVIVSGCAHSGICNILHYAKEISGITNISAVIGGFHLKKRNLQVRKTIEYFKLNNISRLLPAHCTADRVIAAFAEDFAISPVKSGMTFHF